MRRPLAVSRRRYWPRAALGALLALGAAPGWADTPASPDLESAGGDSGAPQYPSQDVEFDVDNASSETFPAFELQLDAARWADLGPIHPGPNHRVVTKQVAGWQRPGSYRLQRGDGSWWLGAYWVSPNPRDATGPLRRAGALQVRIRIGGSPVEPAEPSADSVSDADSLQALAAGDGSAFFMACHGAGVLYGGMVCESEYLDYRGRGWGVAMFPLVLGRFSSDYPLERLLGYTEHVVATPMQGGAGYISFRYNPSKTVDLPLAEWYGNGGIGFAQFSGGFSAP